MYQVRDGQQAVVTCPECGCRLNTAHEGYIYHYKATVANNGKDYYWIDAKGCRCSLAGHQFVLRNDVWVYGEGTNWKDLTYIPVWD